MIIDNDADQQKMVKSIKRRNLGNFFVLCLASISLFMSFVLVYVGHFDSVLDYLGDNLVTIFITVWCWTDRKKFHFMLKLYADNYVSAEKLTFSIDVEDGEDLHANAIVVENKIFLPREAFEFAGPRLVFFNQPKFNTKGAE